jgi:hypothetical protein
LLKQSKNRLIFAHSTLDYGISEVSGANIASREAMDKESGMKKSSMMIFAAAVAALATGAFAQPGLVEANTGPEILCSVDTSATSQVDTVVSTPDSNGFYKIFNGKDFKGWWQNCLSTHSTSKTKGAIWRVDTVRQAIYSMQRNESGITQSGGLLTTRKKYAHYEIVFDWWPEYGDDGGIFNRMAITSSTNVASNQMVLDYMAASGVLGYYSEAGFPGSRNGRPWSYTGNAATTPGVLSTGDTVIAIPGSGGTGGDLTNWTSMTAKLNPTQYGCASTGCVVADLRRLWPRYGWIQVRQRYYGGLSTNQGGVTAFTQSPANALDKTHGQSFFRAYYPKDTTGAYVPMTPANDTAQWIPVVRDSFALSASQVATYSKPSFIGFQIHNGGRFRNVSQGGKGMWYRNIRIRELDSLGMPKYLSTAVFPAGHKVRYDLRVTAGSLVGDMTLDHIVTVTDAKGRVLDRISGIAGRGLRYELPAAPGAYFVQVRSMRGVQTFRYLNRGAGR